MIAVMGATGHTGRRVVEQLLARGERVRAIGRDARRLQPLVDRGAEAAQGEVGDRVFLGRALAGADRAYTLIPLDLRTPDVRATQDAVGAATFDALSGSGVRHVVFLSSVGAELPSGTGPIAGLGAQEARLRTLGANVLCLRAGYFFENFFGSLDTIKKLGFNAGAHVPDVMVPMVATSDIADVAADALVARDFSGSAVREVLGPRDLTMAEATRILGRAIGLPDLRYVQVSYADLERALTTGGMSADAARQIAEIGRAFNEGRIRSTIGRNASSTTPTTLERFAPVLAEAFHQVRSSR